MSVVNGCNLPDDLFYHLEKHIWVKPLPGGNVLVGMTSVAGKLSGGKLAAVTTKAKKVGETFEQLKSVATVESSKFVGPVPTPVTGVLVKVNEKLASEPNLVISDPYGEGWIAEMAPANWESDKSSLVTGEAGVAAYKAKMEAEGISCQ